LFGARPRPLFVRPSATLLILTAIGAYLLVNATWSLSPKDAWRAVGLLFAITGLLYLTFNGLERVDEQVARAIATALIVGLTAGGMVLCIEAFSGLVMHHVLMGYFPALRPHENHLIVWENGVVTLRPHLLNRSISIFTMLFWPALLAVERLDLSRSQKAWL